MSTGQGKVVSLRGVRTNRLVGDEGRGVDIDLPLDALVVVTGVSGSGKSSLAIDTIVAESRRRMLEALGDRRGARLPRPAADEILGLPFVRCVGADVRPRADDRVGTTTELSHHLAALALRAGARVCPQTGEPLVAGGREPMVQRLLELPEETVVLLCAPRPAPADGGQALLAELRLQGVLRVRFGDQTHRVDELDRLPSRGEIALVLDRLRIRADRVDRLREAAEQCLRAGGGRAEAVAEALSLRLSFAERPFSAALGRALDPLRLADLDLSQGALCGACGGEGEPRAGGQGVACPTCAGSGFSEGARSVAVAGARFHTLLSGSIGALAAWWKGSGLDDGGALAQKLGRCLALHAALDLEQLPVLRPARRLAGSEWARLLLIEAMADLNPGHWLVLDEPGARLDPQRGALLGALLQQTVADGIGVLCVDHSVEVRACAGLELGFGPGAGAKGGRVVYLGPPRPPARPALPTPLGLAVVGEHITLQAPGVGCLGAVTATLPVGRWTCVVGENGAGKSTFVRDMLGPALRGSLAGATIEGPTLQPWLVGDRRPPGGPRSVVATALGVWSAVRSALAATREARALGWGPERFSFNVDGGRCPACSGTGVEHDELAALGATPKPCAACGGGRFAPEHRQVRWRGYAADELLQLEIADAVGLFAANPKVGPALRAATLVGLGYLPLGQRSDSLSGGEAQRLALAAALAMAERTGKAREGILVLDAPSAGLHEADAAALARALDGLRAAGLTIVVADLHPAFIEPADLVLDVSAGRVGRRCG